MKLKEEYKDEIQEMIKAGETKADIASHYGVKRNAIYNYIKKYDLDAKKEKKFYVPDSVKESKIINDAIILAVKNAIKKNKIKQSQYDDCYSYLLEEVFYSISASPWRDDGGRSLKNYIYQLCEWRINNFITKKITESEDVLDMFM